jgi:hypothetical protein
MTSIRPTFQAENETYKGTTPLLKTEGSSKYQRPLSAMSSLTHSLNFAVHCCTERPTRYRQCERLYRAPNKVTRQGKEVTSATWAVPIRYVSFRKLEKRASKAA